MIHDRTVPPEGRRVRGRHLTDEVADRLSALILSGELGPGQQLPTGDEFCSQFGVSRTVVREAISRLKADGLIETRQGVGAFVSKHGGARPLRLDPQSLGSPAAVLELFELRVSLETEAAALAAVRRSQRQLKRMRRSLDLMQLAVERGADGVEEDLAFHQTIAEAAANRLFPTFLEFLSHHYRAAIRTSRVNSARVGWSDQVQREHEAIYDAIERGEPEQARVAIRTHIVNGRKRLAANA